MEIAHPHLAWLGLLLLIPLALHLIRKPLSTVAVSTLSFLKALEQAHPEPGWLRRLKRWIALFLSLAMLGGTIAALMRVSRSGNKQALRSVVVVLDRSASMGAIQPDGRTRMEAARQVLVEELRHLRPSVRVVVIAAGDRPELLIPVGSEVDEAIRAVQALEPQPVEGNPAEAIELARTLGNRETPTEIWWLSDHVENPVSPPDPEVRWREFPIPAPARLNAGLTAFRLRPLPLERGRLSCFLEVAGNEAAGQGVEALLEVQSGSVAQPGRKILLQAGEPQVIEFPLDARPGEDLQVRIRAEGDCLAEDDAIRVKLPEPKPTVVVRVGPKEGIDPFAHVALQSLMSEGELQVWSAEPAQWPVAGADVVLFDHWLPGTWPENLPVIVLNPPPSSLGPVQASPLGSGGRPRSRVRVLDRGHPVLFRVDSDRIAPWQSSVLRPVPGLETLWQAERDPLFLAGEWKGRRVVVMGFSPRQSAQLPLTENFPLLMGNAIYWCAGLPGKDLGETGGAHLLSLQETREAGSVAEASEEASGGGRLPAAENRGPRELTGWLLAAVLMLLLLDSLLWHRLGMA